MHTLLDHNTTKLLPLNDTFYFQNENVDFFFSRKPDKNFSLSDFGDFTLTWEISKRIDGVYQTFFEEVGSETIGYRLRF